MNREKSVEEIARRLIEGLASDLATVVFDNRLVDISVVDKILHVSGVDSLLRRHKEGTLVIYTIDYRRLELLCRREECSNIGKEKLRSCISSCIVSRLSDIKNLIVKSIVEAASSLET